MVEHHSILYFLPLGKALNVFKHGFIEQFYCEKQFRNCFSIN